MTINETTSRPAWYYIKSAQAERDILADAMQLYVYVNEGDMSGDRLPDDDLESSQALAKLFAYRLPMSALSSRDLVNVYGALNLFLDAADDFEEVRPAPTASARDLCSSMIEDIKDIALAVID